MADTMLRRIERLSGDDNAPRLRGWPMLVGSIVSLPAAVALLVRGSDRGHTLPPAIYVVGLGVFYTGGAAVLAARRPDPAPEVFGYHELWHTMVLAASVLHYVLIWRLIGR